MSMHAMFVQVDPAELQRIQSDPSRAEALFEERETLLPPAFAALAKTMQDRIRAAGPQVLADRLSQLDPALRRQLEASMGRTQAALSAGGDILKLLEERQARRAGPGVSAIRREVLSLDKAWHGVHYLLCGETEPGTSLLSQAVMGGAALGDDDEGFSGYGPARCFTPAQVGRLGEALSRPETEAGAAARFDPARMSRLQIYPGWRDSDAEWVIDAFRRLRDFYAGAAGKGSAIVTCLV
jgi:hypothetical protein